MNKKTIKSRKIKNSALNGFTPLESSVLLKWLENYLPKFKHIVKQYQKFISKQTKFKHSNFLTGFTLIEMIVAVAVFALLATAVMANFRQGQKNDDLNRAALEFVSNFRKVQTLGMSGQVVNICDSGPNQYKTCALDADCVNPDSKCKNLVPQGGFGIHIEPVMDTNDHLCVTDESSIPCPTAYTQFVDSIGLPGGKLGSFDPLSGDFPIAGGLNYALSPRVEIINYEMQCSYGYPGGCPMPDDIWKNGIDITFRPPKPTPYVFIKNITGSALSERTVSIMIKHKDTEKCSEIKINGVSGEIRDQTDNNCQIDWP